MQNRTLLLIVSSLTLFFCFAAAINLTPYLRGPAPYPPDWQWTYEFVNTFGRIWMPLLTCIILFFYIVYFEGKKTMGVRTILLLVLLSYLLQLSLLYFSRAGIGVLFARIAHPDHNGYFTQALEIQNMGIFFQDYAQNVLYFYQHAQGHPPFSILFFWVIVEVMQKLSFLLPLVDQFAPTKPDILALWNGLLPFQRMSALISGFFIPLLASSIVIPLFLVGKQLYDKKTAFRSACLFVVIPSALLFVPINDTFLAIFPLWSFYFFLMGLKQKRNLWIFLSGIIFSVGLQFSISVISILFIFLLYFFVFWKGKNKKVFIQGIVFTLGLVLLPIVLYGFYKFNSIEVARVLMTGLPEHRKYITWVFFNITDFFIFAGIPIFILFCMSLLKQVKNIVNKKMFDLLPLSFFGMIFILDISGSVRGEVARIWLPYYPFLALIVAKYMKERKILLSGFLIIMLLQVIQVLIMQEFWVTLW